MKIILDTNVFISGIFFGGPPSEIFKLNLSGYKGVEVLKPRNFVDRYLK